MARPVGDDLQAVADAAARAAVAEMSKAVPDEASIRRIMAEVVAEEVHRVLQSIGIETNKPTDVTKDFLFLRGQRETYQAATRHGLLILVAAVMSGIAFAIWTAIRAVAR